MQFDYWLTLIAQAPSASLVAGADEPLLIAPRVGALAAGLALGAVAFWCWTRGRQWQNKPPVPHSPQQLFHDLCQAHQLSAAQERLLEWVVSDQRLVQPGLVFLDPLFIEQAIGRNSNAGVRNRLTGLRTKLFAGLEGVALADL